MNKPRLDLENSPEARAFIVYSEGNIYTQVAVKLAKYSIPFFHEPRLFPRSFLSSHFGFASR